MKRFYTFFAFIAVLAGIGILLYGCGGVASSLLTATNSGAIALTATLTGAAARSVSPVSKSIKAAGDMDDYSYCHDNPWYLDKLQIPSSYKVGLGETKIMQEDDYNSATAHTFSLGNVNGEAVSVSNPFVVDMTSGTFTISSGQSLPTPGTYTHMGNTIAYIEQTLTGALDPINPSEVSTGRLRVYPSTVNGIQAGDILLYDADEGWCWINRTTYALTPITSPRPGGSASGWDYPHIGNMITGEPTVETGVEVIQDSFWSLRTTNNLPTFMAAEAAALAANGYVFKDTMALGTPITIAAGNSYTLTLDFDISATVDGYFTGAMAVPGETGTFFWDDAFADGYFKPFLAFASGGDQTDGNGSPGFHPLPPTITATATSTN
ncbi:MAG: hypothetical protein ABIH00_09485 [Armatimonadota bacterium]